MAVELEWKAKQNKQKNNKKTLRKSSAQLPASSLYLWSGEQTMSVLHLKYNKEQWGCLLSSTEREYSIL